MKNVFVLIVAFFLCVEFLSAQSRNATNHDASPTHEYMQFAIWWGEPIRYFSPKKFIKIGNGVLRSDIATKNGSEIMRVEASAAPSAFFTSLYDADVFYEAFLDPRSLQMTFMRCILREEKTVRNIIANFDTINRIIYYEDITRVNRTIKKQKRDTTSFDSVGVITDGLGAFYRFRSLAIHPSDTISLNTFDVSTGLDTLKTIIVRREKIDTIFSKNTPCIVIEPRIDGYAVTSLQRDKFSLWITDDARKIPVQIETGVAIGKITFKLEKYERK